MESEVVQLDSARTEALDKAAAAAPETESKAKTEAADERPAKAQRKSKAKARDEQEGEQTSDYATGDYVVYPTHGVGRVTGIEAQNISGITLTLISIKFEKDRMTLRVPVEKAHNSGLRKLSTRKVLDDALQTLRGKSRVRRTMWSRRAQEYEAKINSGDPVSIAEVVRDLYRGSDQPEQSYSERQMYQAAMDRLAREFAAVDGDDEATAAQKLEDFLAAA
ncbi:MAG: CarD family transcriptional regulator [Pseudomonadota bacterium]